MTGHRQGSRMMESDAQRMNAALSFHEDEDTYFPDVSLWNSSTKTRVLLQMLGLRAAAALPPHLHTSVLRHLLFQRSLSPSSLSGASGYWPPSSDQSKLAGFPFFKTRGTTVKCLFSAWLTKQSKWLKATRLRYVVLLVVERQEHDSYFRGTHTLGNSIIDESSTQFSQVLLVSFKTQLVPLPSPEPSECQGNSMEVRGNPNVHFCFPQRAEPSEIFSLNSTHRAYMHRLGRGSRSGSTAEVLAIQGLGGRLVVLGMPLRTHVPNQDGFTQSEALVKLGALINACAARCGPPPHSPWSSLFCFLAQGSTLESRIFSSSSSEMPETDTQPSTQVFASPEDPSSSTGMSRDLREGVTKKCSSACALWKSFTIMSWVVQCSLLALHCATRRFWQYSTQFSINEPNASQITSADALQSIKGVDSRSHCADPDILQHKQSPQQRRNYPSQDKHFTRQQGKSLRQLIDEHQRATAVAAYRERSYKAWQLENERQRNQQASRALMDESGHLFPQAERWLYSSRCHLIAHFDAKN